MKLAIGADHAGFATKQKLVAELTRRGFEVKDFGTTSEDSVDYPDYAERVAKAVASGRYDRGLLACGTGLGMCITANKVPGVRAATPWSVETARLTAEHNWCNVLCIPSRFLPAATIKKMVSAWLATSFDKGGRHERRVKKIRKIESK